MLIFLDFDGVLHPVPCKEINYFNNLPLLEQWLGQNETAKIVISSSWRSISVLREQIRDFLSDDVADRIIGMTPDNIMGPQNKFWRQAEIEAWIKANNYSKADLPPTTLPVFIEKSPFKNHVVCLSLCA